MLNAIEMQGHSDDETQADVVENFQDAQPNLPPEIPVLDTIPQDPVAAPPNNECLMQISAEALHGITGQSTLSVLVHINGHQAIALVAVQTPLLILNLQSRQKFQSPTFQLTLY
jgi:hypothetical protein